MVDPLEWLSRHGRIVFSQWDLQGRVDRSKCNDDPVAEPVLMNLLSSERW